MRYFLIPTIKNNLQFGCAKAPKIDDRKWHSIKAIQCHLRSSICRQLSRLPNCKLFLIVGIVLCIGISSVFGMSRAPQELLGQMGVSTLEYKDEKRNRTVVIELWYPTTQKGPFVEPDSVWIHPKEIRDGIMSFEKAPLILMSHGNRGDRRDRSWLSEHLVKNGFVVASVEHFGDSWRSYHPLHNLRFWERARDISFALTALLNEPTLQGKIDGKKVGFVGYSLGGMTGLLLAGAKAQGVKERMLKLKEKNGDIDEQMIGQIDFSECYGNFADSRIKAFALLSPACIFHERSLSNLQCPIALILSKTDEVLPYQEHGLPLIKHLKSAKLMLKENVSHYVFLNRVSEKGKAFFPEKLKSDQLEKDRLKTHAELGDYLSQFFKKHME